MISMRRKDKEITDRAIMDEIIAQGQTVYLGLASNDGEPYVLPLSYGYDGKYFYIHGAKGMKTQLVEQNARVSFCVTIGEEIVPNEDITEYTVRYMSVIGFGKARLIEDLEQKQHALDMLMLHCKGPTMALPEKMLKVTAIIRVEVASMTGKFSVYPKPQTKEDVQAAAKRIY